MRLKKLLKKLDIYEQFQLVNAQTGEPITDVDYLADTGTWERMAGNLDSRVHGISAGVIKDEHGVAKDVYVVITLDNVM